MTSFNLTINTLIKLGAHIGHKSKYRNPAMNSNILGSRTSIDIIHLEKTLLALRTVSNILEQLTLHRGNLLFINTTPVFDNLVNFCKLTVKQFGLTGPWVNGTLTNFNVIRTFLEYKKLNKFSVFPDIVFLLDVTRNLRVLNEISTKGIPVIALTDTNMSTKDITYGIPSNDDSFLLVYFFFMYFIFSLKHFLRLTKPSNSNLKRRKICLVKYKLRKIFKKKAKYFLLLSRRRTNKRAVIKEQRFTRVFKYFFRPKLEVLRRQYFFKKIFRKFKTTDALQTYVLNHFSKLSKSSKLDLDSVVPTTFYSLPQNILQQNTIMFDFLRANTRRSLLLMRKALEVKAQRTIHNTDLIQKDNILFLFYFLLKNAKIWHVLFKTTAGRNFIKYIVIKRLNTFVSEATQSGTTAFVESLFSKLQNLRNQRKLFKQAGIRKLFLNFFMFLKLRKYSWIDQQKWNLAYKSMFPFKYGNTHVSFATTSMNYPVRTSVVHSTGLIESVTNLQNSVKLMQNPLVSLPLVKSLKKRAYIVASSVSKPIVTVPKRRLRSKLLKKQDILRNIRANFEKLNTAAVLQQSPHNGEQRAVVLHKPQYTKHEKFVFLKRQKLIRMRQLCLKYATLRLRVGLFLKSGKYLDKKRAAKVFMVKRASLFKFLIRRKLSRRKAFRKHLIRFCSALKYLKRRYKPRWIYKYVKGVRRRIFLKLRKGYARAGYSPLLVKKLRIFLMKGYPVRKFRRVHFAKSRRTRVAAKSARMFINPRRPQWYRFAAGKSISKTAFFYTRTIQDKSLSLDTRKRFILLKTLRVFLLHWKILAHSSEKITVVHIRKFMDLFRTNFAQKSTVISRKFFLLRALLLRVSAPKLRVRSNTNSYLNVLRYFLFLDSIKFGRGAVLFNRLGLVRASSMQFLLNGLFLNNFLDSRSQIFLKQPKLYFFLRFILGSFVRKLNSHAVSRRTFILVLQLINYFRKQLVSVGRPVQFLFLQLLIGFSKKLTGSLKQNFLRHGLLSASAFLCQYLFIKRRAFNKLSIFRKNIFRRSMAYVQNKATRKKLNTARVLTYLANKRDAFIVRKNTGLLSNNFFKKIRFTRSASFLYARAFLLLRFLKLFLAYNWGYVSLEKYPQRGFNVLAFAQRLLSRLKKKKTPPSFLVQRLLTVVHTDSLRTFYSFKLRKVKNTQALKRLRKNFLLLMYLKLFILNSSTKSFLTWRNAPIAGRCLCSGFYLKKVNVFKKHYINYSVFNKKYKYTGFTRFNTRKVVIFTKRYKRNKFFGHSYALRLFLVEKRRLKQLLLKRKANKKKYSGKWKPWVKYNNTGSTVGSRYTSNYKAKSYNNNIANPLTQKQISVNPNIRRIQVDQSVKSNFSKSDNFTQQSRNTKNNNFKYREGASKYSQGYSKVRAGTSGVPFSQNVSKNYSKPFEKGRIVVDKSGSIARKKFD